MCNNSANNPFTLRNSTKAFKDRQKSIFDQLSTLQCNLKSKEYKPPEPMDLSEVQTDRVTNRRSHRSVTRQFRGKESIFKVPRAPASYMKSIPDFKKNPHKWTKYSLEDVKDEDMSDASNTRAALSFLKELESRNKVDSSEELKQDGSEKVIFKKVSTSNLVESLEDDDLKPTYRNSKLVMPEYIVGQKVKKEKRKAKSRINESTGSSLKLDHLYEDE